MSEDVSTKPYLIRALYEWCCDCGYTPYLAVAVDESTVVPREFVKNGEIVLNISPLASNKLQLGNDMITFQARFGGLARELSVPITNVVSIYARETGHGMAFDVARTSPSHEGELQGATIDVLPVPTPSVRPVLTSVPTSVEEDEPPEPPTPPVPGGRPQLKRIK